MNYTPHIFGIEQSEIANDSPLGSPTVRSKPIVSLEDWLMRKHGISLAEATKSRKRRNGHKEEAPKLQMTLF